MATHTSAAASTTATPVPQATSRAAATTPTGNVTSVGAALGGKIALYAVAKAAGMTSATQIDALADGLCARLTADPTPSGGRRIGPWLAADYHLQGNRAAAVAITAIRVRCPQFLPLVGQ